MAVVVIAGATASGKSGVALEIAAALGAQIVSADSMQLYIGADIGTAKLSVDERMGIAHHMLDLVPPSFDLTVNWYQERAREVVDNLVSANSHVVIVGGTGLYLKSILEELDFPARDLTLRAELAELAQQIGQLAMHQRLALLDPAAAAVIPSQNSRRVIRAIEVVTLTGAPYSAALPRTRSVRYQNLYQYALGIDRAELDARINTRVEKMWAQGIEAECDRLIEAGLLQGQTAKSAIGYAQILAERSGAATPAMAATALATRQYARRQITWFKREPDLKWVAASNAAKEILHDLSN